MDKPSTKNEQTQQTAFYLIPNTAHLCVFHQREEGHVRIAAGKGSRPCESASAGAQDMMRGTLRQCATPTVAG